MTNMHDDITKRKRSIKEANVGRAGGRGLGTKANELRFRGIKT